MSFKLEINGEVQSFDSALTVQALIERLGLQKRRLAIELNGEILPRDRYEDRQLSEGDKLEIVHAIGGG